MLTIHDYKDRLNLAFRAMRKAGLVARQNFACCGTCGSYEIRRAIDSMPLPRQGKVTGIAFYHHQDNARMRLRGFDGLHLSYGGESLPSIEVGHLVLSCLRQAGIAAEWDGDVGKRVFARFAGTEDEGSLLSNNL